MKTVYLCSRYRIPWWRQFPREETVWDDCRFLFQDPGKPYDYLVVWDRAPGFKRRCAAENTIHVCTEPISIQRYDQQFIDQFARCITIDPEISHPGSVYSQTGLNWALGWKPNTDSRECALGWHELRALFDEPRTKLISVIASDKAFTPQHKKRLVFAKGLKEHFGDRLDFFGRGLRNMDDKLEALRGYRFHLALENSSYPHYFSEKLSDPLIAGCQPIYWGCPNITDYFPEEALILIDLDDIDQSINRIENAIAKDEDQQRQAARRVARDMVFYEHNIFALLTKQIDEMEALNPKIKPPAKTLLSRAGWVSPEPSQPLYQRIMRRLNRYTAEKGAFR